MSIKKTECYVPYCDVCGTNYESDYIPHYDTEAAALEEIQEYEWVVRDGRILCPECSSELATATAVDDG